MMQATVCKQFKFHAAHVLPNHDGQCRNLHGHSYKLEVFARGPIRPSDGSSSEGMVVDFSRLKEVYRKHIEPHVEHQYLNDTLAGIDVTTAESIAGWMFAIFKSEFVPAQGVRITHVRVWETDTSYAEVGDE